MNEALTRALRASARTTSPEELARRGVGRVQSMSVGQLAGLIDRAVNRTLMESTIGVEAAEVDVLVAEAQEELLRLMRAHRSLDAVRSEIARARAELQTRRVELRGAAEARRSADDEDRGPKEREEELRKRLRTVFAGLETGALRSEEARAMVVRDSLAALRNERAAAGGAPGSDDLRFELLERRITKLLGFLTEAEEALERTAARVDVGVPSMYRKVQGVDIGDPLVTRKLAILSDLYQENARLQLRA